MTLARLAAVPALVAALAAIASVAAAPASGETRTVAGIVVDENNRPVPNARIRLVAIGSPLVGSDANFRYEVPADTTSVVLELLEPKDRVVRYPPGGNLVVAAPGAPPQTVVIGLPAEKVALDASLDDLVQIEKVLKANGRQLDSVASMLSGMQPLLAKLNLSESDLAALLAQRRARNDLFTDVSVVLDTYVLHLKDFVDGLARLAPAAFTDRGTIEGLQLLLTAYNQSFTSLNADREAVAGRIENAWSGADAETIRNYWNAVTIEAIDRIHRGIVLPLSPEVEAVQIAVMSHHIDAKKKDEALAAFADAKRRLDVELAPLESSIAAFRRSIERGP